MEKLNIKKMSIALCGTMILAAGIFLILSETNGADPMSVFLQGVHLKTGVQIGTINQLLNGSILLLVFLLDRSSIGIASIIYVTCIGFFMNLFFAHIPYESMGGAMSIGVTILGVILIGIGAAVYVFADYGAGAVEGLMVVLNERTGLSLTRIRMTIDLGFVVIGFLLGGVVGIGTIAGVLLVGPTIEGTLHLLKKINTRRIDNESKSDEWMGSQA
ncbi:hypothetical protein SANA_30440 [Gottschalkiaceae bacterium SANA]|nr:hypothetical protein SANA_30440 [Gottschalkiaceae bacterium SANA]